MEISTCKSHCRRWSDDDCYLDDGNHVHCIGGFPYIILYFVRVTLVAAAAVGLQLAAKIVLGIPCELS
nr:hypothetical protein CFP56_74211 [Quercus suber]